MSIIGEKGIGDQVRRQPAAPAGCDRLDLVAAEAYLRSKGIKRSKPFIADDFDVPLPEDFLLHPLPPDTAP